jgi:DNA-binding response OmpR family regulator/signal recognition particle receptor subunit beta
MPAKILVVDDEPKWLRIVELYLQGRQHQVMTAATGQDALDRIKTNPPDLIIADIGMPDMDGYELCRRVRQDAATRAIPFLFLTGHDDDAERIKARKIGSDDFLTKPCSLERLAAAVESAIERIEQARQIAVDQPGTSGRLEDVDLLDLIQTVELEQRTGALVLSHGERTATLYFRQGAIVDADIRSPKREEPLFVLLGWKTGRFLFLPDAEPDRMPITASVANLLFQDLKAFEQHEQRLGPQDEKWTDRSTEGPTGRILVALEETARRVRENHAPSDAPTILRLLIVGLRRSGKSDLIHGLVKDLSRARWAAMGIEQATAKHVTDFGRVRTSHNTVLHLIAVRAEKRFWPMWEQCLPGAIGAIFLVNPPSPTTIEHLRAFLRSKDLRAPTIPVHAIVASTTDEAADGVALQDIDVEVSTGSLESQTLRMEVLEQLLQKALTVSSS